MKKLKLLFYQIIFRHRLKNGKIIPVSEKHRALGKTKLLVDIAIEKELAIVVGTQRNFEEITSINPHVKVLRLAPNFTLDIKGASLNHANGVLLDDSVDPMMIVELDSNDFIIRGGFIKEKFVSKRYTGG